ncbi:MAG: thioredoxin family protein [Candidatus Peribacteria bacterium]|nr:MAG: thioredoxin family protein [Candidatus Peribacteria bacterium]
MFMHNGYLNYSPELLASSLAEGKQVVLYFHADWCPTCQVLEKNIEKNNGDMPVQQVILKVEYDTEKELKKTYGVTAQHTLVYLTSN